MSEIGKKIKEFREDVGMTQEQLADKMGKSLKTLQRYEKGENIPSISVLKKIGDILGQDFVKNEKGSLNEDQLVDMVLHINAMLSVSLDAMAEILAASSNKTVSEARSSLAKAVEHRIAILKGSKKS